MNRLDPELVGPLQGLMEATGGFDLSDIPATRAMVDGMVSGVNAEAGNIAGVDIQDRSVPSHEAGVEVPIRIYRPSGVTSPLPVLQWMHPGGFVIGSIEMDHLMAMNLSKALGCAARRDPALGQRRPSPALASASLC